MESNEHLRGQYINISQDQSLTYWSGLLECDKADLIKAVMKIGTNAKMVDDFLILNRRKISVNGK